MAGAGAKHAGVRGSVTLSGVLDLHVGCRGLCAVPIRRSRSATEGALARGRPAPFMRSGGKRSARGVRRESVFAERWSKRPTHLANPDDRKRAPRHETQSSPDPARKPGPGNRVKLGFSVFEKWVVCRMVRPHLATNVGSITGALVFADPIPASRSRRGVTVRIGSNGAGDGLISVTSNHGKALRVPCSAPLNPVRPAGALGGRVQRAPKGAA
jgi:hypothetical protein